MTSSAPVLGAATIQEFRQGVRGEVVLPGDGTYETDRQVWNGSIDRRPAVVVRCSGAADVIAAVRFARSNDLAVAVRGGGHNVAGFGTCDGGLVIDLGGMRGTRVDPRARTATAQGGLTWGQFDHETQAFGLGTTGGLVSGTGVAGLTLGGGLGWLVRKHGYTIDNLLGADVVTADGRLVRASEDENADLFWGLRGGGGNFGIVTSFDFKLHPVGPIVYGGPVLHTVDRATELLEFYAQWAPTLPDEMTTLLVWITAPPEPFIPEALRFKPMVGVALCYAGPLEDGEAACKPLRDFGPAPVDLAGPIPYTVLQGMFDGGAPRGIGNYWRTDYLDELSGPSIATLAECATGSASPFSQVHIYQLGGTSARVPDEATALGRRDAPYILNTIGAWMDPALAGPETAWVRATSDAMRRHAGGGEYANFMANEGQDRVRVAYGPEKYGRLAALKSEWDPTNFFRINQNIEPAPLGRGCREMAWLGASAGPVEGSASDRRRHRAVPAEVWRVCRVTHG